MMKLTNDEIENLICIHLDIPKDVAHIMLNSSFDIWAKIAANIPMINFVHLAQAISDAEAQKIILH